jgi:hypothetical protein
MRLGSHPRPTLSLILHDGFARVSPASMGTAASAWQATKKAGMAAFAHAGQPGQGALPGSGNHEPKPYTRVKATGGVSAV